MKTLLPIFLMFVSCVVCADEASLRIEQATVQSLLTTPVEGLVAIELQGSSVHGISSEATMRRIEIYAPNARVLVAAADGFRELPRDNRLHFISTGGERLGLSISVDGKSAEGILFRDGITYAVAGSAVSSGLALQLKDVSAPDEQGNVAVGSCAGGLHDASRKILPNFSAADTAKAVTVATRQAVIAVDTDNEFMLRKFSDNTTAATNYVTALFVALNVIYEDDFAQFGLQTRLLQGDLTLRPSTTPDPYSSVDGSANNAALNEFGNWWQANRVGVPRAFAMHLSGKSSSSNSSSGIAWIISNGTYCSLTSGSFGHYSVNRIFYNPALTAAQDAYLVGHELGHNFGADHTHCSNATTGAAPVASGTIDACFNGESGRGCYSGAQSCPVSGPGAPRGTLMSYCHFSSGANCGNPSVNEFHPTHVTLLNTRISSQPNTCITPLAGANIAPTINVSQNPIVMTEDVTRSLNMLSFADPDAGAGMLLATIANTQGSLAATSSGGVTVGGSSSSRTLTGTLSNLNTYLSAGNLTYSAPLNATSVPALSVTINDQGNTGTGGAQSANTSIPFSISAVNDAPVLIAPATLNVASGEATAWTGVSGSDVDVGAGNLRLTISAANGIFNASPAGGVAITGNSSNAVALTATPSTLNGYLVATNIAYTPSAAPPTVVAANLLLSDLGNTGSGGTQTANASVSLIITPSDLVFRDGFE